MTQFKLGKRFQQASKGKYLNGHKAHGWMHDIIIHWEHVCEIHDEVTICPLQWLKFKRLAITNDDDVGEMEHSYFAGRDAK